jgi:hypothetical protein
MQNKLYADICGNLENDIEIRCSETGQKHGVIIVEINRSQSMPANSPCMLKSAKFLKVVIWNASLLEKLAPSLKQGTRVWVASQVDDTASLVVNLHDERGIVIVSRYPQNTSETFITARSAIPKSFYI